MTRLVWLADVLRADGLTVIELEGWQGRGRDDIDPQAVIAHHTATGPGWSDESVVRLLRDGRSDLPGPLSQLGLRRDGRFDLIAAGRANHNGARTAKYGNDSIGIEAYNDGQGEPWPAVQLDAFERGSAALLRRLDLPVSRCVGHKESDPTRKVDPRDVDMNTFRSKVARHLIAPQEDDMTPEQAAQLDRIEASIVHRKTGTAGGLIHDYSKAVKQGVDLLLARDSQMDPAAFAAAVVDELGDDFANDLLDALKARL